MPCSLVLAPILLPILFKSIKMSHVISLLILYSDLTRLAIFRTSTRIDNIYTLLLCTKMARLVPAHSWADTKLKTYFLLEYKKQVRYNWN